MTGNSSPNNPGTARPDVAVPIRHALVVGCPRSGTTLLQSALAAHPAVFSSPETHFFTDTVGQRQERLFGLPPASTLEQFKRLVNRTRVALHLTRTRACRRRLASFVDEAGRADLLDQIPRFPLLLDPVARRYIQLGDRITRELGKSVWLEKTPGHLHYLDLIERFAPDLRVLCIVRSAPDNIASMYDVAMRYPDRWAAPYRTVEGCVARWLASARAAWEQAERPGRMFVAYEELAVAPERVTALVCRFLGLAYVPGMIENRNEVYHAIVRDREPHKRNVQENIRSRNGTKFNRLFDSRQQAFILAALGEWPARLEALCASQSSDGPRDSFAAVSAASA